MFESHTSLSMDKAI